MTTKKTSDAGMPELSDKETAEAKKDGLKQAIADSVSVADIDGLPGDEEGNALENRFRGSDEVLGLEPFLDLAPDRFKAVIAEKGDDSAGLTDTQLGGLYKLERNGQNRTPYVKALRDRLKLKKDEHVPGAGGPGYTNNVSDVSDL